MAKENKSSDNGVKFYHTFKFKLILSFLIVVTLTIVVWTVFTAENEKKVILRLVEEKYNLVAKLLNGNLNQFFFDTFQIVDRLSKQSEVKNLRKDKIQDLFDSTLKTYPYIKKIALLDLNGNISVLKTNTITTTSYLKYWYLGLIKGNEEYGYFSGITFDDIYKTPMLIFALPVRNEMFQTIGLLVAEVDFSGFKETFSKYRFNLGDIYLLTSDMRIIFKPENSVLFVGSKFVNAQKDMEKNLIFSRKITVNIEKLPRIALVLKMIIPKKVIFAPINQLRKKAALFLIVLLILAVWLAFIVSEEIVEPIRYLVDRTRKIMEGDLDVEIKLDSSYEMEILANSFSQMKEKLKKRLTYLKFLYEAAKEVSSVLEYEELLETAVKMTLNLTGADRISIMIYDEETAELVLEKAYGLPDDVEIGLRKKVDIGLAGWVFKTGKTLVIEDASQSQLLKGIKGDNYFKGSMILLAMQAKQEKIGVLSLTYYEERTFEEDFIKLIESFVNQLSIAIYNAILYKMAITDGMTKLYIHRYFQQRLDSELSRAKRYNEPVALIMTDIDHFKSFNDTYGHQTGDRVLKTVAKILRENVRSVDIPCRYGGEEFAVICPAKNAQDVYIAAERLRKSIENYEFIVNGKRVPITISLGIASFPEHAVAKLDLIEAADKALYWAKITGRNKTVIYGSFDLEELERLKKKK